MIFIHQSSPIKKPSGRHNETKKVRPTINSYNFNAKQRHVKYFKCKSKYIWLSLRNEKKFTSLTYSQRFEFFFMNLEHILKHLWKHEIKCVCFFNFYLSLYRKKLTYHMVQEQILVVKILYQNFQKNKKEIMSKFHKRGRIRGVQISLLHKPSKT